MITVIRTHCRSVPFQCTTADKLTNDCIAFPSLATIYLLRTNRTNFLSGFSVGKNEFQKCYYHFVRKVNRHSHNKNVYLNVGNKKKTIIPFEMHMKSTLHLIGAV